MTAAMDARRRPVTRQQYMVRRAVVGGGLLVVLLVLVLGVRAAVGGGGDGDEPAGTSVVTAAPGSSFDIDDVSVPTVTGATSSTVGGTTTTTTVAAGPPTAENPATVLVVGDSNAGAFAPYLDELLEDTGVVRSETDYKVSSGLSRPDFFDWPAHLRATVPALDPDIVVVTFGGNDAQPISDRAGNFPAEYNDPISDEEAWKAEYSRRAGEVMDLLSEDGRHVIWVGIPNAQDAEVTARMRAQDEAAKAAAASRPEVVFVDTWRRFSGRSGNWAEFVVDPRDGKGKDVRSDEDGFHLNEIGADILALDIANVVRAQLVDMGASL